MDRDIHVGYSLDVGEQVKDSPEKSSEESYEEPSKETGEARTAKEVEQEIERGEEKGFEEPEEAEERDFEEEPEEFEEEKEEEPEESEFEESDAEIRPSDPWEEDAVEIIKNDSHAHSFKISVPAKSHGWKLLAGLAIVAVVVLFFIFKPSPEQSGSGQEVGREIITAARVLPEINDSQSETASPSVSQPETKSTNLTNAGVEPKAVPKPNADEFLSKLFESGLTGG